jgi:hypothetical protein
MTELLLLHLIFNQELIQMKKNYFIFQFRSGQILISKEKRKKKKEKRKKKKEKRKKKKEKRKKKKCLSLSERIMKMFSSLVL